MNHGFIDQTLPNIFIAGYVLFALFWDSPETNLLHKALRSKLAPLVRFSGIGHSWSMYAGPFATIARLETRITYSDNTMEVLPPIRRYEFRRYYFMIGVRSSTVLYDRYLRLTRKRLRHSVKKIGRIEIVRLVSKSPVRVGGVLGRFEVASAQGCRESVVAVWTRA